MATGEEVTTRSALDAPAEDLWHWATSAEGVNHELRPSLRMTVPPEFDAARIEELPIGERLGRSWILLFGVVPIEYDDLTLVRVEPGRGFLERSPMLSQRKWEHERTIEPAAGGSVVSDRVRSTPRLGLPPRLFGPVVAAIFRHRHRRLRSRFGGRDLAQERR